MIGTLEEKRKQNFKNLQNVLNTVLNDEPLDFINENEEEIYKICNDLKSYLEDFSTT